MNWALRILAFVALLATLSEFASPNQIEGLLGTLTAGTAADLALAVGVVALVDAAQRRRRGWFARLLMAVLATVYGPFLFVTLLPYAGIHLEAFTPSYTIIYVVTQAITPLVALLYTLPRSKIEYV